MRPEKESTLEQIAGEGDMDSVDRYAKQTEKD